MLFSLLYECAKVAKPVISKPPPTASLAPIAPTVATAPPAEPAKTTVPQMNAPEISVSLR